MNGVGLGVGLGHLAGLRFGARLGSFAGLRFFARTPGVFVKRFALIAVSLAGTAFLIFFCQADVVAAPAISPAVLMRSANNEFQAGRFASASIKYSNLLERNLTYPQLREVLTSFCESTLREGKLAKAESLTVLAKAKISDPMALGRVAFLGAEILYFRGDTKQATKEYVDFLSANKESPLANDAIDRLLLMDENSDNEGRPLVAYSHAEFFEFAGMPDSATAVIRELLRGFPDSQIADDARMKMGDILSTRGKFLEAVEEYRALEASFPQSGLVPVSKLKTAAIYSDKLRESDKAAVEYEGIVTAFPGTSFAAEARSQLQKLKVGSSRRQ